MTPSHGANRLADHREIVDTIYRYCRGVDRRDWDAVRSTMHPDCHDDHGDYSGGVDGFIEWVSKRHAVLPQCMHCIMNCLVEFESDDVAVVESYFVRMRAIPAGELPGDGELSQTWARYVDVFERRANVWKVSHRTVVFESIVSSPVRLLAMSGARQERGRTDAIYAAQQLARGLAGKASRLEA